MAWIVDENTGEWTYVPDGETPPTDMSYGPTEAYSPAQDSQAYNAANNIGPGTSSLSSGIFSRWFSSDGTPKLGAIAADGLTLAGAIAAFNQAKQGTPPTGYQGGIPSLVAHRAQTAAPDPNVRAGAGGHQYFTGTQFSTPEAGTVSVAPGGTPAVDPTYTIYSGASTGTPGTPGTAAVAPALNVNTSGARTFGPEANAAAKQYWDAYNGTPSQIIARMTELGLSAAELAAAIGTTPDAIGQYIKNSGAPSGTLGVTWTAGTPATAGTAGTAGTPATPLSTAQKTSIKAFWDANKATPNVMAQKMQEYGVNAAQLADIVGMSNAEMGAYIKSAGVPQGFGGVTWTDGTAAVPEKVNDAATNATIKAAWEAGKNDPAKVRELMTNYGVSANQLAAATGMTPEQVGAYLRDTGAEQGFGGVTWQGGLTGSRADNRIAGQLSGLNAQNAANSASNLMRQGNSGLLSLTPSSQATGLTPAEIAARNSTIKGTWDAGKGNSSGIASLMNQYGVNAQYLADATGQSGQDIGNYLRGAGMQNGFAGVTQQNPDPNSDKFFGRAKGGLIALAEGGAVPDFWTSVQPGKSMPFKGGTLIKLQGNQGGLFYNSATGKSQMIAQGTDINSIDPNGGTMQGTDRSFNTRQGLDIGGHAVDAGLQGNVTTPTGTWRSYGTTGNTSYGMGGAGTMSSASPNVQQGPNGAYVRADQAELYPGLWKDTDNTIDVPYEIKKFVTNAAFQANKDDPNKIRDLMAQNGVSAADLNTATYRAPDRGIASLFSGKMDPAALQDQGVDSNRYLRDNAATAGTGGLNNWDYAAYAADQGITPGTNMSANWKNDADAALERMKNRSAQGVAGQDAYLKYLKNATGMAAGGMAKGRYLQGATDGMADQIPAQIDGSQPAALAHGEFVVPADVVSHLGNGNSDAGADQLYKMMDKIRMARTGTKKQGKQIDPNKFAPGGIAKLAAGGKVLGFSGTSGSTVPANVNGIESNLSNWAGPYVTNMLGQGQALAQQQIENPAFYQGPLSAGDSALQQQAYGNAANLATPGIIGQAADYAGAAASKMGNLNYTAAPVSSAYTAPSTLNYTATNADYRGYTPTNAANVNATAATLGAAPTANAAGFSGPRDVNAPNLKDFTMQAATGTDQNAKVTSNDFIAPGTAASYMSPYMDSVVQAQQRDAQRQADIASTTRHSQQTQAGAFGGSRGAIQDAEAARNLALQKGDINTTGQQAAYQQAQTQFNADQARNLAAQQSNQGVGAQYGLASLGNQQQAGVQNLSSFLQTQGLGAQTGLQAQQSNQGMDYNTALQNAQLQQQTNLANQGVQSQYGLQQGTMNQQANMQTAAQNQQTMLQNANAANQANQFGAGAYNTATLQNANAANQASQFGINASLQNASTGAQYGQAANQLNANQQQFGANYVLQGLQGAVSGAQAAGGLGALQNSTGLANLNAQATLGGTQQATQQAGIAADQAQWNQQQQDPFKMVQYQQSLLQGLPLQAQSYNTTVNPYAAAAGTAGGIQSLITP